MQFAIVLSIRVTQHHHLMKIDTIEYHCLDEDLWCCDIFVPATNPTVGPPEDETEDPTAGEGYRCIPAIPGFGVNKDLLEDL